MEYIPIKTRVLHPPKDDLFAVFDSSLTDLRDGDIVLITSKVVSIHEGRCVPVEGADKGALVQSEAEFLFKDLVTGRTTTITRHALISSSGIDESNGNGYYTLLPERPFASAETVHTYLTKKYALSRLGVIITDSHSVPLRYGALSISIGCWGFKPVESHAGKKDIFGRPLVYSKTNFADALAAGATLVSGECDETSPIVLARNVPHVVFTNADPRGELLVPPADDLFASVFKIFTRGGRDER